MSNEEDKSSSDEEFFLGLYVAMLVLGVFAFWVVYDEGKHADKSAARHKAAGHRYIKFSGNKYGSWCTYSATTGQWTPVIEYIE